MFCVGFRLGSLVVSEPRFGTWLGKQNHIRTCQIDFPLASKIMVRNLSYSTTESLLKKEFSNFGQIEGVNLVMDKEAKRSKGYAFIQYTCQDDAMLALENMDCEYFDGRVIHVELAKPARNSFGRYPTSSGPPQQQNTVREAIKVNEDLTDCSQ